MILAWVKVPGDKYPHLSFLLMKKDRFSTFENALSEHVCGWLTVFTSTLPSFLLCPCTLGWRVELTAAAAEVNCSRKDCSGSPAVQCCGLEQDVGVSLWSSLFLCPPGFIQYFLALTHTKSFFKSGVGMGSFRVQSQGQNSDRPILCTSPFVQCWIPFLLTNIKQASPQWIAFRWPFGMTWNSGFGNISGNGTCCGANDLELSPLHTISVGVESKCRFAVSVPFQKLNARILFPHFLRLSCKYFSHA